MSAIDYIPRAGSLPGQACLYFAEHPVRDHHLTRDEVAEKWDAAKQSVHTLLNAAVGADLLTRFSTDGALAYKAGPNLRAWYQRVTAARGNDTRATAIAPAVALAPRPPAPTPKGFPLWPDATPPNVVPASPAVAPAPHTNALTRALASAEQPEAWDAETLQLDTDVPLPKAATDFDWLVFLRRFKVTNSRLLENRHRRTCAKYATQLKNDGADPRHFLLAAEGDTHFRIWRKA